MSEKTDTPIMDAPRGNESVTPDQVRNRVERLSHRVNVSLIEWNDIANDLLGAATRISDLQRQLAESMAQRDRLAEALRMIATHNEGDGQCDNGHTPRWMALDALATLERKEEG